ncbi:MAG: M3 family metallopeptidase [Bacteroidales bacterium]|nr:M3 family metallopeptidase [Candidatus Equibacterium intestinale]
MRFRQLFTLAATAVITLSCNNTNMNPLLTPSGNPFGAPAFDKIENKHYLPAFEQAIKEAKAEVDAIINNPEEPSFENTIEALSFAGMKLNDVGSIFFNLNEACTDEEMQALAEKIEPMLTEYSVSVSMNADLFAKIKAVYEKRDSLELTKEQARLLDQTYKSFARSGADLPDDKKAEYAKVQEELSLATLQFGKNVLAATNAYTLHITDTAQLAGLPEYVREMGASEAAAMNLDGWVYTLKEPSYFPFVKYSECRDLREQMWKARSSRCLSGDTDNSENIRKIIALREKSAQILGFDHFADMALEFRMAKTPETVNSFLADLMEKSLPFAKKDVAEIQEYANVHGFEGELMPWDFSYWSEKLQEEKYSLNEEMLKPYFELGNVRKAVLGLATTLYGLTFEERTDIPKYHPDVITYEVKDGDRFMGLLYMDFFPRESKRGGAWMTSFRDSYIKDGEETRPFVQIVTNFTKPTENTPSLLTFDEVTTILHEFGHGLHGLLAEGSYTDLTGTSVARDFVELPSQIMENWAYEPEFLCSFAKHYQTGEVIPQELVDRIIAAKNYLAGYSSVRQLQFGIIDMAWHSGNDVSDADVAEFEKSVLEPSKVIALIDGTAQSPSFTHIFSGGYSAGYYSYKWAEVLEADAFSLFKEKGIFNKEVAASFRENILSKGNLEDADELFRAFRGRDPRPEALLEKSGMVENK